jgi:IstB-like ATP binding protein
VVACYGRLDLLCLDELAYLHVDPRGAELLFQVLTEREERASIAVAGGWGQMGLSFPCRAATGPSVTRSRSEGVGHRATTPLDGLKPTRPQSAAGMRTEPPASVRVAIGTIPAATAAAEPPLEPPGDQSTAHGFRVGPKTRLSVCPSKANSGTLALPSTMAPAALSRDGTRPSCLAGGLSA